MIVYLYVTSKSSSIPFFIPLTDNNCVLYLSYTTSYFLLFRFLKSIDCIFVQRPNSNWCPIFFLYTKLDPQFFSYAAFSAPLLVSETGNDRILYFFNPALDASNFIIFNKQ